MRSQRLQKKDVFYKDRSELSEGDSATIQVRSTRAYVKDYSLKHKVTVEWEMNQDSVNDRMCIIQIGNSKAVCDWEEILRAGRFI